MNRRNCRPLLVACASLLIGAPRAYAQIPLEAPTSLSPVVHSGANAIQVEFSNSRFRGATVSALRHASATTGVRVGVTFSSESDASSFGILDAGTQWPAISTQSSARLVGFHADYLAYASARPSLAFFAGVGPQMHTTREDKTYLGGAGGADYESHDGFGAGLDATAGAEWFFLRPIGLIAEYRVGYEYFQERTAFDYSQVDRGGPTETEGFRYVSRGLRAGLSVHFQ